MFCVNIILEMPKKKGATSETINSKLALVMKSGKAVLGMADLDIAPWRVDNELFRIQADSEDSEKWSSQDGHHKQQLPQSQEN